MTLREAGLADLDIILKLYTALHNEPEPPPSGACSRLWQHIAGDTNRHIILVEMERIPAASCELIIVPNLTHGQRPYGLIENVVTAPEWRRRGCALAALNHAVDMAEDEGCYKLMLMTSGGPGTHALYEAAGFNTTDKTAFVRWL